MAAQSIVWTFGRHTWHFSLAIMEFSTEAVGRLNHYCLKHTAADNILMGLVLRIVWDVGGALVVRVFVRRDWLRKKKSKGNADILVLTRLG